MLVRGCWVGERRAFGKRVSGGSRWVGMRGIRSWGRWHRGECWWVGWVKLSEFVTGVQGVGLIFLFPRQNFYKNSKMEKSIIYASFLLIFSITTIILLSCNYGKHFSNQKSPSHISQTAAGTFLASAPPSSAGISPPPPKTFDWFCRHNYQNNKTLPPHNFIFSYKSSKFEFFAKYHATLA